MGKSHVKSQIKVRKDLTSEIVTRSSTMDHRTLRHSASNHESSKVGFMSCRVVQVVPCTTILLRTKKSMDYLRSTNSSASDEKCKRMMLSAPFLSWPGQQDSTERVEPG